MPSALSAGRKPHSYLSTLQIKYPTLDPSINPFVTPRSKSGCGPPLSSYVRDRPSIDRQEMLQPVLGRDQAQLGQRFALNLADALA